MPYHKLHPYLALGPVLLAGWLTIAAAFLVSVL